MAATGSVSAKFPRVVGFSKSVTESSSAPVLRSAPAMELTPSPKSRPKSAAMKPLVQGLASMGALKRTEAMCMNKRFSEIVDATVLKSLEDIEVKRQETIFELIDTERFYVRDISYIIEIFLRGAKSLLSPSELEGVFSNIVEIYAINDQMLSQFTLLQRSSIVIRRIGHIFLQFTERLKAYSIFCSNHQRSVALLPQLIATNFEFKNFLDSCSVKVELRHLCLPDFLIMPIQRICKYPLLLRDILNHTPQGHPDFEDLTEALQQMKLVVDLVNEATRKEEQKQQSSQLENKVLDGKAYELARRQVIFEGECKLLGKDKKKGMDCKLVLLEGLVLILTPITKKSASGHSFEVAAAFDLTHKDNTTVSFSSAVSPDSVEISLRGPGTDGKPREKKLLIPSKSAHGWIELIGAQRKKDDTHSSPRLPHAAPTQSTTKKLLTSFRSFRGPRDRKFHLDEDEDPFPGIRLKANQPPDPSPFPGIRLKDENPSSTPFPGIRLHMPSKPPSTSISTPVIDSSAAEPSEMAQSVSTPVVSSCESDFDTERSSKEIESDKAAALAPPAPAE